jgi:acylphosphatase
LLASYQKNQEKTMSDPETSRLHAEISGRVQGVGFRMFVLRHATGLGLTGWVRNRWDSRVEVIAEGERHVVEKLLAELRRGPRSAYVSDVKEDWSQATGEFNGFHLRSTA